MYRLLAAIFAVTLVLMACGGGAPGASPGGGGSPGGGDVGGAALDELCGTGDASLTSLAGQLEELDDDSDTTQVSAAIGEAMTNLEDVEVDAAAATARDAAVAALQQVQTALADPETREEVADQAAQALRTLEGQICV